MKTSWIQGVFQWYFIILLAEMMVSGGTAFDVRDVNYITALMGPSFVNSAGSTSALVTIATKVGTYFTAFVNAVFLCPNFFTGYWLWFWFLVCLPISIAVIVSIVMVLRGVHAG